VSRENSQINCSKEDKNNSVDHRRDITMIDGDTNVNATSLVSQKNEMIYMRKKCFETTALFNSKFRINAQSAIIISNNFSCNSLNSIIRLLYIYYLYMNLLYITYI